STQPGGGFVGASFYSYYQPVVQAQGVLGNLDATYGDASATLTLVNTSGVLVPTSTAQMSVGSTTCTNNSCTTSITSGTTGSIDVRVSAPGTYKLKAHSGTIIDGVSDQFTVLASTYNFIVNTTNDTVDANPGDGTCADTSAACSLRA